MAGSLLPQAKQLFQDNTGGPLIGGKIYTYAAGTLTPKDTFQDAALTIANTNPVIANSRGEVVMYGAGAYRIILKDAAGATLWDRDNVESSSSAISTALSSYGVTLAASDGSALVGHVDAGGIATTVQARLRSLKSDAAAKVMYGGVTVPNTEPAVLCVTGSPASPFTRGTYRTPVVYAELHTNGANADSCDWGNAKKNQVFLAEAVAYGAETGEINAFSGRVFSAAAKPDGAQPLVGASFLAQSNAPAGMTNRDVFGANIVAASSTGNPPTDLVGIEVDIIPSGAGASTGRPGIPGQTNYTAYWAQSAGGATPAGSAFFASATGTGGWQYGMVINCDVQQNLLHLRTVTNSPTAKGARIETQWQNNQGRVLELFCGTNEQFRVDGDGQSPVWIRSEGVLKQVTAGAADSGGVGYKLLKVPN